MHIMSVQGGTRSSWSPQENASIPTSQGWARAMRFRLLSHKSARCQSFRRETGRRRRLSGGSSDPRLRVGYFRLVGAHIRNCLEWRRRRLSPRPTLTSYCIDTVSEMLEDREQRRSGARATVSRPHPSWFRYGAPPTRVRAPLPCRGAERASDRRTPSPPAALRGAQHRRVARRRCRCVHAFQ